MGGQGDARRATPVRLRGEEAPLRPAPRLGEHGEAVLREAGLDDAEIAALAEGRHPRRVKRGHPTCRARADRLPTGRGASTILPASMRALVAATLAAYLALTALVPHVHHDDAGGASHPCAVCQARTGGRGDARDARPHSLAGARRRCGPRARAAPGDGRTARGDPRPVPSRPGVAGCSEAASPFHSGCAACRPYEPRCALCAPGRRHMRTTIAAGLLAAVLALPASGGAQEAAPRQSDTEKANEAEKKKKLEEDIARELAGRDAGGGPAGDGCATWRRSAGCARDGGAAPAETARLAAAVPAGPERRRQRRARVQHLRRRESLPAHRPFGPADKPAFLFEELELGLQAVVDPVRARRRIHRVHAGGRRARGGLPHHATLPAGLQLRAGQALQPLRPAEPAAPARLGVRRRRPSRSAAPRRRGALGRGRGRRSWLAPLPWFATLHLAAQNTAPGGRPRRAHRHRPARAVLPLGDTTTLGVGLSAARRDEPGGGAFRDLGGVDLYLRCRPLASRSYLALSGELYARRFRDVEDAPSDTDTGGWAQAFWRQSRSSATARVTSGRPRPGRPRAGPSTAPRRSSRGSPRSSSGSGCRSLTTGGRGRQDGSRRCCSSSSASAPRRAPVLGGDRHAYPAHRHARAAHPRARRRASRRSSPPPRASPRSHARSAAAASASRASRAASRIRTSWTRTPSSP